MTATTPESESIIELAETIKELVRILRLYAVLGKWPERIDERLEAVYSKLVRAKDRVS